jgi:hypothetical protein
MISHQQIITFQPIALNICLQTQEAIEGVLMEKYSPLRAKQVLDPMDISSRMGRLMKKQK